MQTETSTHTTALVDDGVLVAAYIDGGLYMDQTVVYVLLAGFLLLLLSG